MHRIVLVSTVEAQILDHLTSPKALGHAFYNMGMSYMMGDEHDTAIGYFTEAARLRPGDIVNKEIADCQRAKGLAEAIRRIEEHSVIEEGRRQAESARAEDQARASTLTNEQIIMMAKKKVPDAIVDLTGAGISEQVIVATPSAEPR